jgi:uncharacterized protein
VVLTRTPERLGHEIPVLSADSHVVEPPDLWTTRIGATLRDRAPRVVEIEDSELWVVDGTKPMAVVGIQAQAGRRYHANGEPGITKAGYYRDIPELTSADYLAALDVDGVGAAVLFPSQAHQAYRSVDGSLLEAIARVYNDWIIDYCRPEPARLGAVAMIPVDDISSAVTELSRAAAAGAVGALIPILPRPGRRYDDPMYFELWEAAEALQIPLLMHVGGNQAVLGREPPIDLVRHATKDVHIQVSLATLILSGVLARFPALRIGAIEFGANWAVYLGQQLDRVYVRDTNPRRTLPDGELPSEHLRRNVFLTFQEDRAAVLWRHTIGVENLLWGNDFPHAESTYPHSLEVLSSDLAGIPGEDARRIVGGNTAETFRIGLAGPPGAAVAAAGGARKDDGLAPVPED